MRVFDIAEMMIRTLQLQCPISLQPEVRWLNPEFCCLFETLFVTGYRYIPSQKLLALCQKSVYPASPNLCNLNYLSNKPTQRKVSNFHLE
jgi:hypothetical protein